jgi:hypothetical protein
MINFVSGLRQVSGFLYITLSDKVCQWLATGWWIVSKQVKNKILFSAMPFRGLFLDNEEAYLFCETFVVLFSIFLLQF